MQVDGGNNGWILIPANFGSTQLVEKLKMKRFEWFLMVLSVGSRRCKLCFFLLSSHLRTIAYVWIDLK